MPSSHQGLEDHRCGITPLTTGVHATCESYDLRQSSSSTVLTLGHSPADGGERLKVPLLTGQERISLEVRNDDRAEEREASHLPLQCSIAPVRP